MNFDDTARFFGGRINFKSFAEAREWARGERRKSKEKSVKQKAPKTDADFEQLMKAKISKMPVESS